MLDGGIAYVVSSIRGVRQYGGKSAGHEGTVSVVGSFGSAGYESLEPVTALGGVIDISRDVMPPVPNPDVCLCRTMSTG